VVLEADVVVVGSNSAMVVVQEFDVDGGVVRGVDDRAAVGVVSVVASSLRPQAALATSRATAKPSMRAERERPIIHTVALWRATE
jgi:hypothetical protein